MNKMVRNNTDKFPELKDSSLQISKSPYQILSTIGEQSQPQKNLTRNHPPPPPPQVRM